MLVLNNWCVWQKRNVHGRVLKMPLQVNGQKAKADTPATWTDIRTACNCIVNYPDSNLGLGFFLPADRSISFVDLDSFNITDPLAMAMLSLVPCYAEISQSGNGFHLIFLGKNPGSRKRLNFAGDHHEVEWYDNKRFIALTTNRVQLNGNDFTINPDLTSLTEHERNAMYELLFQEPATPVEVRTPSPVVNTNLSHIDLDESELMDKMLGSSQGWKVKSFMQGTWKQNYHSWSEADMAFANILAFWTQKDVSKMRSIFNSSSLYRPKDDQMRGESTYQEQLFERAINDTSRVYDPHYRSAVIG